MFCLPVLYIELYFMCIQNEISVGKSLLPHPERSQASQGTSLGFVWMPPKWKQTVWISQEIGGKEGLMALWM